MLSFSKNCVLFLVLALFLTIEAVDHELPSYFPRCHRTDPNLSECLLKATETVRPFLEKGVPELDIAPLDELRVSEVNLVDGSDAFNFKAKFKNILVKGLNNYKFSKFEFDVPNMQFFTMCHVTNVNVTGDYEADGRVLVIPISGKGPVNVFAKSVDVTFYQKVKLIKKGGQEYIHPTYTNSTVQLKDINADIKGLFNGDDGLSAAFNKVINDNVDILIDDLKPTISRVISKVLNDFIIRKVISAVPYDKLY